MNQLDEIEKRSRDVLDGMSKANRERVARDVLLLVDLIRRMQRTRQEPPQVQPAGAGGDQPGAFGGAFDDIFDGIFGEKRT
jgi:hypothetical protein